MNIFRKKNMNKLLIAIIKQFRLMEKNYFIILIKYNA